MAGSVTVSKSRRNMGRGPSSKMIEIITVDWTADSADGSVPDTAIPIDGYVVKAVTNPGSTAPTANYDITLVDPEDSALDALAGALANRHTTNTEQVYPLIAGSPGTVTAVPPLLAGSYTMKWANNAVNSATGRVILYVVDEA